MGPQGKEKEAAENLALATRRKWSGQCTLQWCLNDAPKRQTEQVDLSDHYSRGKFRPATEPLTASFYVVNSLLFMFCSLFYFQHLTDIFFFIKNAMICNRQVYRSSTEIILFLPFQWGEISQ